MAEHLLASCPGWEQWPDFQKKLKIVLK